MKTINVTEQNIVVLKTATKQVSLLSVVSFWYKLLVTSCSVI